MLPAPRTSWPAPRSARSTAWHFTGSTAPLPPGAAGHAFSAWEGTGTSAPRLPRDCSSAGASRACTCVHTHTCVDVFTHVHCVCERVRTNAPREWVMHPSTLDRPRPFRVPVRVFWVCIWVCVFLPRVRARVCSCPCTLFLPSSRPPRASSARSEGDGEAGRSPCWVSGATGPEFEPSAGAGRGGHFSPDASSGMNGECQRQPRGNSSHSRSCRESGQEWHGARDRRNKAPL